MLTQRLRFMVIFFITLSSHIYAVEGDPVAGRSKAQPCVICHGVDGNSTSAIWPKLSGQHAEYLFKQLQDFRSGERESPQMSAFVAVLNEQDMWDIAAYYAAQKTKIGYTSVKQIELGRRIYNAGDPSKGLPACTACHGPRGSGNPLALFPALSGQHAEYTKAQLLAFRDKKRTNSDNKAMNIISERMVIDEIDAVANYIQGLH